MRALRRMLETPEALYAELPEDEAFTRHTSDLLVRNMRLFTLAVVLAMVIWGVIDVFAQPPATREIFLWNRALVSGLLVTGTMLLSIPWFRARPMRAIGPVAGLCALVIGHWMGALGGPETPWIHCTYIAALIPMASPVSLVPRVLQAGFGFGLVLVGYFGTHPEYLESALAWLVFSFTAFAWVVSVIAGEIVYSIYWRAFVASRRLDGLVHTLEARVREKTRDLATLARDLESRIEDERLRLAHAIHDELGQELAAMKYAVSLAARRYANDHDSIAVNLASLEQLVEHTGATTRLLVSELRPRILDEHGLVGALEWLTHRSADRLGFEVTFVADGTLDEVPGSLSVPVFRTVQEAITNIARHARATCASVLLDVSARTLRVEIADDGQGMPATVEASTGMGILGMIERARMLGGRLDIVSNTPRGTRVRLVLPFDEADT